MQGHGDIFEVKSRKSPVKIGDWAKSNKPPTFADVVGHFLLSRQSHNTREAYARDIRDFLKYANRIEAPVFELDDVTERLVLLWQKDLQRRHTKFAGSHRRVIQTSVARKLSSLASLMRFAQKRGLVANNPFELITRPKLRPSSKTNALNFDEVKTVLSRALEAQDEAREEWKTHPNGRTLKNYKAAALRHMIFTVLFTVGLRVDELCELRIADVEDNGNYTRLHMTTKGGDVHSPIIHQKTAKSLLRYIDEFRSNADVDEYIFVRSQNVQNKTRMSTKTIYDMVKDFVAECGIRKRITPHSCRATLATLLHRKSVPIGQIQELLNHKNIITTSLYIKKASELEDAAATKIDLID